MSTPLAEAAGAARGHFRYESGHHGDLWLDLDRLLADARRTREWAAELARLAAGTRPEVVCGPLTGGAFVAQLVAAELGADFVFAERAVVDGAARYRVPDALRPLVRGRRVLLVDDAVNAGSALLASLADVRAAGGEAVGFASLLALGDAVARIGAAHALPFVALASLPREMWAPHECPLCAAGVALVDRVAP